MEDKFSKGWEEEGWFQDDSSALHLLCILLLFRQLHLRPSDIRSQRLRTLAREGPKGSLSGLGWDAEGIAAWEDSAP